MDFCIEEGEEDSEQVDSDIMDGAGDRIEQGGEAPGGGDGDTGRLRVAQRGVRRGSKRGPYKKRNAGARQRIIESAQCGEDWKATAVANGVAVKTAYGYITRPDDDAVEQRGGATYRKVTSDHVDKLVGYVEENPQVSLKEMARKLKQDTGLELSIPTVHRHLHGRMYTIKKIMPQPERMNSAENKEKRALYARKVTEAVGAGKTVLYMDETDVNLFLRRSQGRSLKGTRCSVKATTARGPNVHVIGAMTQTRIVYWERRRGSLRKDDCNQWLREALRRCPEPCEELVVVCDNAPVHAALEQVAQEDEFAGMTILRLAPYSAPLNPIEHIWSVIKATMKQEMAATFIEMLQTALCLSQLEHRLRYLEAKIDPAMAAVTPRTCLRACNHVQRHFPACLALEDLPLGQ